MSYGSPANPDAPERPLDALSRPLRDLRISVTDRCNFRCTYCMPAEVYGERYHFLPRNELLAYDEIARIAGLMVSLGVHKVRVTGGEPLVRKDLATLIAMLSGIENMLRHYVPEITAVQSFEEYERLRKPEMNTPEALIIRELLSTQINPSVAEHGGHIALIDVQPDTVYIRLEGGCQGCGMADVTLKSGIETAIKQAVPTINAVLDVTDHAGGNNPYYAPGKGGVSPV